MEIHIDLSDYRQTVRLVDELTAEKPDWRRNDRIFILKKKGDQVIPPGALEEDVRRAKPARGRVVSE